MTGVLRVTFPQAQQRLEEGPGPCLDCDLEPEVASDANHNADNERVKHQYLLYLKEARRLSESSIDTAMAAIARFEAYTRHRDFRRFHIRQAVAFKRKLSEAVSVRTGERLSSSTVLATLNALRAFFEWLAMQPGYRSRITHPDADYFALSERETRIAKTTLERPVPTVEQILPCPAPRAVRNRDPGAQSGLDRLHPSHRRPRWRDRYDEAQARRHRTVQDRAGCP